MTDERRPPPWAMLEIGASTPQVDIDAFLSRFRPSHVTQGEFQWISVYRTDAADEDEDDNDDAIVDAWEALCARGDASAAALDRLAREHNIVSGKWMVFRPTAAIDSAWSQIVTALAAGQLGPSAKVSPRNPTSDHVICVYCADYLDRDDVQRVRRALRALGHEKRLLFKPDVYTICGVYKGNEWGLPTYLYAD